MKANADQQRFDTRLVHTGEPRPGIEGAVSMPIFQTAMYEHAHAGDAVRYIRYNNTPNHEVLHKKLAALEGTEAALVTGSGMAAISAALLSVLRPGDRLLAQSGLYGGTFSFVTHMLAEFEIAVDFFDATDPEGPERLLHERTRAVYAETITNPLCEVGELAAVGAFAQAHGLAALIDNTFATPLNFRPAEWGFDLILHSATKYLNGHSDLVAGVVAGTAARVAAAGERLKYLGGTLDPHACFLLHRGMKTLALRVRHQNASALRIAQILADHPGIEAVHYPGLATDPHHARAARFLDGFGGMMSFTVRGGANGAERFMEALSIPILAPSLGGVETLVTRPAATSHAVLSPAERAELGIHDGLLRLSVGIEAPEDLIADLTRALDVATAVPS